MERVADRTRDRLVVVLCATPWLLLSSAYGEAVIAAALLTRWPRPWLDDPMSLATAPLHLLTITLIVVTWASLFTIGLVVVTGGRNGVRSAVRGTALRVFAAGMALVALLVYTDPGAVWYWLGD
jgi:hypothetical protein